MLDSWDTDQWILYMYNLIRQSEYAEFSLVIKNGAPQKRKTLATRFKENRGCFFYRLYMRLEKLLVAQRPDAFAPVTLDAFYRELPVVHVSPRQTKFCDYFPDEAVDEILKYDLDVVIRNGFRILKGRSLACARHGVWSYHHGDNLVLRGGPSGFWEVFTGAPVTGSILQILSEKIDDGMILSRSFSSTNLFCVQNSRNKYFWKTAALIPRALKQLHAWGEDAFYEKKKRINPPIDFYDDRMFRPPRNGEFLRLSMKHAGRLIKHVAGRIWFNETWLLMYRIGDGMTHSLRRLKPLEPPKGSFWADPHVAKERGRYFVFYEDYSYETKKGVISVLELNKDGIVGEPQIALEEDVHLSYPMVFSYDGCWYMIPETSARGRVDLYRCNEFPHKWEYCKTLMDDVHAVDATIHQHNGLWWMWMNMKEHPACSYWDELFLFYADNPISEGWLPHPMNPVVSDARKARPAGRIIVHNGNMFRVAQDCSRSYGKGIVIHQINVLTKEDYQEEEVDRIEPHWDARLTGLHTLQVEGDLTIIDARRKSPRLFSMMS